jgi:hypothetical protein
MKQLQFMPQLNKNSSHLTNFGSDDVCGEGTVLTTEWTERPAVNDHMLHGTAEAHCVSTDAGKVPIGK